MTITLTPELLAALGALGGALLLLPLAAYLLGRWHGSPVYEIGPAEAPEAEPALAMTEEELADLHLEVAFLPPITAPIDMVATPVGRDATITELVLAPVDAPTVYQVTTLDEAHEATMNDLRTELALERQRADDLAYLLAKKDRLRDTYLRLLKVERARLDYVWHELLSAPRRPSKAHLAAERVEVHSPKVPKPVPLVPRPVLREWQAAA